MTKPKFGWINDSPKMRVLHPAYHEHCRREMNFRDGPIPVQTRIDLRRLCSPVKTQLWNNCTGHGITGALEFLELQEYRSHKGELQFNDGLADPMSSMFIYWHERQLENQTSQDNGAMIVDGIQSVKTKGTVREAIWPETSRPDVCPSQACWTEGWNHREFFGFTMENDDMTQVKASITAGFPVVFGTEVFESFMNPGPSGMIPIPNIRTDAYVGGHCMLIVGYDDTLQCMIVKNSWGTAWGDKGYCYIPYKILTPVFASAFWTLRRVGSLI